MYLFRILIAFFFCLLSGKNLYAQKELWGMTASNGNIKGVIFKTDSIGNSYTDVYAFNNVIDGIEPYGSLIQAKDGNLYGMTSKGGANNYGVIFQINPQTSVYTKVHDFDSINGMTPYGSLCQASNGKLYGLTYKGGTYVTQFPLANRGILFEYDLVTRAFSNKAELIKSRAGYPFGSLIEAKDGMLYALCSFGGVDATGAIIQYDISTSSVKEKGAFIAGPPYPGYEPMGSLVQASNGKFYGLSRYGQAGASGGGVIFDFDATITMGSPQNSLHKFSEIMPDAIMGYELVGSLIQASNGKLYGMTKMGGINDAGTIFEFDLTAGNHKKLYDLDSNIEGYGPNGSLMQASDGKIYGLITSEGKQAKMFQHDIVTNKLTIKANVTGTPYFTSLIETIEATTSLNDNLIRNSINIYPNPASDVLSIDMPNENFEIMITTIDGKVVFRDSCPEKRIDVSKFQSGTYVVNIKCAEQLSHVQSIIVQH